MITQGNRNAIFNLLGLDGIFKYVCFIFYQSVGSSATSGPLIQ